jgi:hypothetical protein
MLLKNLLIAALAPLLLFFSCAPSLAQEDVRAMRCDVRGTLGYCYEYIGKGWEDDVARADCDALPGGSFSFSSCPVAESIGTCLGGSGNRGIKYQYYEPPFTRADAKHSCTGSFISR